MNDRFTSAVNIARDICVFEGDTSYSHIARVLRGVGRAVTDVQIHGLPSFRSEFVQIQDNLTAPIPDGAAMIVKVGVLNDHGQIIHLYQDDRLRRFKKNQLADKAEVCTDDLADITASIITKPVPKEHFAADWYHGCPCNVGNYGELYGYRFDPASIGSWRANEVDGCVEFGSGPYVQPGRWVIIEFKDMSQGRFAYIPIEAVPPIMSRASWYLTAAGGAKEQHYRNFQREFAQMKRHLLRMDILDYVRAIGVDHPVPYQVSASDLSSSTSTSSSGSTSTTTPAAALLYFNDDDAAIAAGLNPGDEYLLTDITLNNYSLPGGLHKTIYNGPTI